MSYHTIKILTPTYTIFRVKPNEDERPVEV